MMSFRPPACAAVGGSIVANSVACIVACDRIEIITGTGRRKSWTVEEKMRLVAEASGGRGSVTAVSRRHGVCRSLLYRWRRVLAGGARGVADEPFTPVVVARGPHSAAPEPPAPRFGIVEIALRNGRVLRVAEDIAPSRLAGLASALEQ
ncbi:MAG: transposase [Alphaproteobacteria bacterium]|nr:transposase [Alphaproteobacteria bacterium]